MPDCAIQVPIEQVDVFVYRIPTDQKESDGTLEWNSTTLVVVNIKGGGKTGLGFTYASHSTAVLIDEILKPVLVGRNAMAGTSCWLAMVEAIRNQGRPGICSMAIAAVDIALWDLK